MGDSDDSSPKAGVPSWQLKPSDKATEVKSEGQDTAPQTVPPRAALIKNARMFLLEDDVRNASTDKQVAFLESKGLNSQDIEELLGVARNVEATNPESASIPSQEPTSAPATPKSPPQAQISSDMPPIITYPEFLTTTTQPAPLITAQRLLTTLYLFGGFSALLYGTNNYLIKPMIESLTSSRHDLAESAQNNIDRLVGKLGGMVSETPQALSSQKQHEIEEDDSDCDPTELFHRDIGVQTSLPNSPSASRPTSPTLQTQTLETQTQKLRTITSRIKDLNEASASEGREVSQLSTCISILRDHLDNLAYIPPSYSSGSGGMYGGSSQKTDAIDDEISKVKAQIRGVKGVLLSAKSFPGGNWQRQSTLAR